MNMKATNTNPAAGVADADKSELSVDQGVDKLLAARVAPADEEADEETQPEESNEGDAPEEEEQGDEGEEGNDEEEQDSDEDSDSADEDDEEQEDDKKTHSIMVDGQEHKVTSKELKEYAQKGLDYTNKTKALGEERKQIQTVQSEWKQKTESVISELQLLEVGLTAPRYKQEEIDALMATDPAKATQLKHEEDKRLQSLKYVKDRIATVKHEQAEAEKAQLLERKKENYQRLVEVMPEMAFNATDKKPSEAATRLNTYLLGSDFTQEDIDSVVDHRYFVMAEKARKYDELTKGKKPQQKKPVPKVTKKTVVKKPLPKRTAMDKLSKSGSIEDALDVLLNK